MIMRAVLCTELGSIETLRVVDLPSPVPGANERLIDVAAAGLNFADTLMVRGQYQDKPALPFVPGMELAGTLRETGERVLAVIRHGAFAEQALAERDAIVPIPAEMDFATAAALPIAHGTADLALSRRGNLRPGESLLVLGAAGGVGLAAVEVGKALGARVIAAARGEDHLAIARMHGADETVDYAAEDVRARLKALAPIDVVLDCVGGGVAETALRALAPEGRYLVVGFASGTIPQFAANLLLVKNIAAIGVYWGATRQRDPSFLAASMQRLFAWWREGRLRPRIDHRFALEDAPRAMARMLAREVRGKIVLLARP